MPGESPAVFGDALRRLAGAATYLYQDGPRYWYSTQPTVTKLAEDRAEQLKRDPDKVVQELDRRLRADLRKMGDFAASTPLPQSGAGRARRPRRAAGRARRSTTPTARSRAARPRPPPRRSSRSRGNTPRLYRNTLVFLAADKTRLQDLDEAVAALPRLGVDPRREGRRWTSSPQQVKQAETQKRRRRRRRDGAAPGDVPVAAGAGAGDAAGGRRVAGVPALRARTRWPCGRARS